jgi:hypothetical protein
MKIDYRCSNVRLMTVPAVGEGHDANGSIGTGGDDECTSVQLSPAAWRQLVGEPGRMRVSTVYVDARTELDHRRLLAAGPFDVDYRLAEQIMRLLAIALRDAARWTNSVVASRASPM